MSLPGFTTNLLSIMSRLGGPRRPPSIHINSFNCTLVNGDFDHDLTHKGFGVCTGEIKVSPLLHHLKLSVIARHVYDYMDSRNMSLTTLCQFLRRLDDLESDVCSTYENIELGFPGSSNRAMDGSSWVHGQRSHLLCSINFIRLVFCRVLLEPRLPTLPAWSELHLQASVATSNVVNMLIEPPVYQMMWYVNQLLPCKDKACSHARYVAGFSVPLPLPQGCSYVWICSLLIE